MQLVPIYKDKFKIDRQINGISIVLPHIIIVFNISLEGI